MYEVTAEIEQPPAPRWKWDERLFLGLTILLMPYAILSLPLVSFPPGLVRVLGFWITGSNVESWLFFAILILAAIDLALVLCRPYDRKHAWGRLLMLTYATIVFAPYILGKIWQEFLRK